MPQASNHSACPSGESPRGENRARLYDEVTATIMAQLEAGRFPWVQPWGRRRVRVPALLPPCRIMR
jgi:antirestriction protein ArdC